MNSQIAYIIVRPKVLTGLVAQESQPFIDRDWLPFKAAAAPPRVGNVRAHAVVDASRPLGVVDNAAQAVSHFNVLDLPPVSALSRILPQRERHAKEGEKINNHGRESILFDDTDPRTRLQCQWTAVGDPFKIGSLSNN